MNAGKLQVERCVRWSGSRRFRLRAGAALLASVLMLSLAQGYRAWSYDAAPPVSERPLAASGAADGATTAGAAPSGHGLSIRLDVELTSLDVSPFDVAQQPEPRAIPTRDVMSVRLTDRQPRELSPSR